MNGLKSLLILSTIAAAVASATCFAETVSETVFAEGVSGQIDTKGRTPVISVGSVVKDGSVVLLVNAYSRHSETKIYPIKFEVFINNNLVSSQLKPAEQVEPLIVPINPEIATAPLSYTVHAQIIHPSRTFSSVYTGSVYNSNFVGSLACKLTLSSISTETTETESVIYNATAEDVEFSQTGDETFTISFKAQNNEGKELNATTNVTMQAEEDDLATITIDQDNEINSYETFGSVELSDDQDVSSLTFSTEDETVRLTCSK